MLALLISLLAMLSASAQVIERTGKMFEIGKTDSTPLFIHRETISTQPNGEKLLSATIKDSNGELVMTEDARFNETAIISHKIEQLQIKETYELTSTSSEITMKTLKSESTGLKKLVDQKTIARANNFIVGPVSIPYLQKHFDSLTSGNSITADFGIYEVMKKIEFKFRKSFVDEKFLTIRMKPSSFFFNLFVEPMEMRFDRKTKFLVWFKGRTAVRKNVNGKFKPFDSEIIYETTVK